MTDVSSSDATTEQAIVIERIFDAPREMVWKAWTEPERFKSWYGPQGFTVPVCKIDLRVGGHIFVSMESADGWKYSTIGTFKEIDPPARLVYADSPADEDGNVAAADGGMPAETIVTVTFEDVEGKTKMTMRHECLPAGAASEGATMGWNQAFDKLAEQLNTPAS